MDISYFRKKQTIVGIAASDEGEGGAGSRGGEVSLILGLDYIC